MKRRVYRGPLVMRLTPIQHCSNRRFYRLAVMRNNDDLLTDGIIEDLGSIDPMPNRDNEILVALNIERIKYYLGRRVPIKGSVGPILGNFFFTSHYMHTLIIQLFVCLGLAGLLPVHPDSYLTAYRNQQKIEEQKQKEAEVKLREENEAKAAKEATQKKK
jgi:small subunit ribosomal protein S16